MKQFGCGDPWGNPRYPIYLRRRSMVPAAPPCKRRCLPRAGECNGDCGHWLPAGCGTPRQAAARQGLSEGRLTLDLGRVFFAPVSLGWAAMTGHPPNGAPGPESNKTRIGLRLSDWPVRDSESATRKARSVWPGADQSEAQHRWMRRCRSSCPLLLLLANLLSAHNPPLPRAAQ